VHCRALGRQLLGAEAQAISPGLDIRHESP
jgi:hypothetical protein